MYKLIPSIAFVAIFILSHLQPGKPTGDLLIMPHSNSYGVDGLATQLYARDKRVIAYTCNLYVLDGYIVGTKATFSTSIKFLNVTTGETASYYKVGLDPSVVCLVPGCSPGPCPTILPTQFCIPANSYDIYLTESGTGILPLDTSRLYQCAIEVHIDEPSTIKEKDQNNYGYFGFVYRWDPGTFSSGAWVPAYDSTIVTQDVVHRLKSIR